MLGLANGLTAAGKGNSSTVLGQTKAPIVACGDSLTVGVGSSNGQTYPARAAMLLDGRTVINQGVGGQAADSIAARQGGIPILVSVANDLIPAHQPSRWAWPFTTTTGSAIHFGGDRGGSAAIANSELTVETPDWLQGVLLPLGQTLPQHTAIRITLDIVVPQGMSIRVSGFQDYAVLWAANDGGGSEGISLASSGRHSFVLKAGGLGADKPATMNQLVFLTETPPSGSTVFAMKNLTVEVVDAAAAVSVPVKSVAAINPGDSFSGRLSSVHGVIASDSGGNWTFRRDDEGAAVPCPAGSAFIPDAADAHRRDIHWIWAGNNGVTSTASAEAAAENVSAMAAHVPHGRYLVLSALPRPDRVAAVATFNTMLASVHGTRYVDVLSALRAGGNGSTGDVSDLTAGLVPRSLRIDDIHLTDAGYAIVAASVAAAMKVKRW